MKRKTKRVKPDKSCQFFAPLIDDQFVEVSIHKWGTNDWGVSVWGDDDFGMETHGLSCAEAYELFDRVKDGLSKRSLKTLRFNQA